MSRYLGLFFNVFVRYSIESKTRSYNFEEISKKVKTKTIPPLVIVIFHVLQYYHRTYFRTVF